MEEIYAAGGDLAAVFTLAPDRARAKSGRVYVEEFCRAHDIPLRHVGNINDADAVEAIRAAQLDWLCIIGWSQIARAGVLAAPREGCLGMHPTLLPTGRGRAAIPWAILKGLPETGVTLFKLDEGVDSGPILSQLRVPIGPDETATELYAKVEQAHRDLIRQVWPVLMRGEARLEGQDEGLATYWPGRTPEDGRLERGMHVEDAERLIRAVTRPYPGAFMDADGQRVRVWRAIVDAGGPSQDGPLLEFNGGRLRLLEWETEPIPTGDIAG